MASLEYRILSKMLTEGTLSEGLRLGLQESHFKDVEARQIWRFFNQHWYDPDTTGTLPTLASIQRKWLSFKTVKSDEAALAAMLKDLKLRSYESDLRGLADYFGQLVDEDFESAAEHMHGYLNEIMQRYHHAQRLGMKDIIIRAKEHYESAAEGSIYGLPWPWKCVTEDLLGKRAGKFFVFYARPKQMKTWVLLYNAVFDYLENNCRVIVWSKEMDKEDCLLRIASLIAKVDYHKFTHGKLPKKMKAKAWDAFDALLAEDDMFSSEEALQEGARLGRRQFILLCGKDAPNTLRELEGEIEKNHPHVVYLDSFYHLTTDRQKQAKARWERIGILAEDTKQAALNHRIPFIVAHQANRAGEKNIGGMADIADSDILGREADGTIRVIKRKNHELYEEDYEGAEQQEELEAAELRAQKPKLGRPRVRIGRRPPPSELVVAPDVEVPVDDADEEEDENKRMGTELAFVFTGNREGVLEAFTTHAIPGYNFDFISSDYSLSQIQAWIKEDEDVDPPPNKGPKKPVKPKFNKNTFKKLNNLQQK